MSPYVLNQEHSVANHFLAGLRDTGLQQDRFRFRQNLKRLGSLLAYEMSKSLNYKAERITTPLAEMEVDLISDELVLIPIMRAALPFYEGFLEVFDQADSGFIGAWRVKQEGEIDAALNYMATPDLSGKTVIVVDPMLATGKSLQRTIDGLMEQGQPKALKIASVIAAPEGVAYLENNISVDFELWTCAIDEKLNENAYIVPGLGDAGDLAFGNKL